MACDAFLPLVKTRVLRWSRYVDSVVPLFPCYLFARLSGIENGWLRYAAGVRDLVRFGSEPAVVPDTIITELQRRCVEGPIQLPEPVLVQGQKVRIVEGPFRNFEGIFERYYSGSQRVAILLQAISGSARIIVRKGSVSADNGR